MMTWVFPPVDEIKVGDDDEKVANDK